MRVNTLKGSGEICCSWLSTATFWMLSVGFAIRVALIFILHTYRHTIFNMEMQYGCETGGIAFSLVVGQGFSSPWGGSTGPTAWLAPLYPYICSLAFRVFGVFTDESAIAIFIFNSLCSALTAVVIYKICDRLIGKKVALIAGWIWALNPFYMRWATTWVWESSLSPLLIALLFLYALDLAETSSLRKWLAYGVLIGVCALTNPSLLAVLPACIAYAVYRLRRDGQPYLRPVLIAAAISFVCIAPWLVRNRIVFGKPVFLRSNFGFELHLGNYHTSNAYGWFGRHPIENANEMAKYREMGELAYVSYHQKQAFDFIRQNPREFADLTLRRILYFWDGSYLNLQSYDRWHWKPWMFWYSAIAAAFGIILAVGNRIPGALMLAGGVLLYPLPYYITYAQPRYRHPIDPELLIFVVYVFYEAYACIRARIAKRFTPHPVPAPAQAVEVVTE